MSFFDDASLVFLPSGEAGKDGKAYSMKPTNGNGDFTFSRGSNLTATRVDSNGLIEKGRENLLLQSNQFDTTWTLGSGLSLTSGQSGYDGSSDAWVYSDTSTGNSLGQTRSTSGVQTLSIYAKAGTADGIRLRWLGGSGGNSYFNIADSSTEAYNTTNTIQTKKESIGNGWFRISIVFNSAVNTIRLYVADGSSTSSTSGNIYIQDAQLEIGLVATEYIESGATTGKAGLLEDSPRFDYSGGASCPSLLLEPSRTNLIDYSEYLQNALTSGQVDITFTPNYGISPEGVKNSTRIQFADNSAYAYKAFTITTDTTASVYVKGTSGETFRFGLANNAGSGGLLHTFSGEWERISNTRNTNGQLVFSSYGGTALDFEAYGLQVEEASYPTSYIPNHSGGSVTRNADVNTLLNQSGVIGQTAGTILFDAYFDEEGKVNFSISDSSANNFISIETTSSNEVTAKVEQGGSTQATITTATSFFAEGDRLKCAIAYDDRDMAFYINGTQVNTAAPNLIPACDDIRFGNYDGSIKADQRVNRVVLFTTRISNGNLATLTS